MNHSLKNAAQAPPPKRFIMRGPGRPYISFAIVATAAIVLTMVIVPATIWQFGFLCPVWVIGHACIVRGGLYANAGDVAFGRILILGSGIVVFLFLAAVYPLSLMLAVLSDNMPSEDIWMVHVYPYPLPIYLVVLFAVMVIASIPRLGGLRPQPHAPRDNLSTPARAESTRESRIPIGGRGKPYLVFAAATTAVFALGSGIDPVVLLTSPIWIVGQGVVALGGISANRGKIDHALTLVRIGGTICLVVALFLFFGFLFFGADATAKLAESGVALDIIQLLFRLIVVPAYLIWTIVLLARARKLMARA